MPRSPASECLPNSTVGELCLKLPLLFLLFLSLVKYSGDELILRWLHSLLYMQTGALQRSKVVDGDGLVSSGFTVSSSTFL